MKRLPRFLSIAAISATVLSCSGDDDKLDIEGGVLPSEKTYSVFNPAFSEVPVPSDLQFSGTTDGTQNAGDDISNPVISGIDALDGNSILAPFDIAFSASLDPNQTLSAESFIAIGDNVIPNPNQNVFLLPLLHPSGDPVVGARLPDGTSVEVPTFAEALAYQTAVATKDAATLGSLAAIKVRADIISLDGGTNNVLRISPLKPLKAKTKYLVVVTGLKDAKGNPVFRSIAYDQFRDPDIDISAVNPRLAPLSAAVKSWERLALGYFGFKKAVFDVAGVPDIGPTADDILFTMTFTTAGVKDVLTSIAAPNFFFEEKAKTDAKIDAILKLTTGVYKLKGPDAALTDTSDIAINTTMAFLLSSPMLPDSSPNALYSEALAAAIIAGADYASIANSNASSAFIMQTAAAQAAIQVKNSGDESAGDDNAASFFEQGLASVSALSGGNPAAVFPLPSSRSSRFFRVDPASALTPLFAGEPNDPSDDVPTLIYQGEITLPHYSDAPSASGIELLSNVWEAQTTIPTVTPPSNKITYRFPFPAKKTDLSVPLLAVMPNPQIAALRGKDKPAAGWPVVIYVHGITSNRASGIPMANGLATGCLQEGSPAPCFATIAIDQPLHGLDAQASPLMGLLNASNPGDFVANLPDAAPESPSAGLAERHFGFSANAAGEPITMDFGAGIGSSGSLFINLKNFPNTADRLRQMVIDLLNLNASIADMDIDGDGLANDIDPSKVYVIGHSLGAIDSIPFVTVNNSQMVQANPLLPEQPKIQAAAFLNVGGGLPRLLVNSKTFAPPILGGLAAASEQLTQGRSGFQSYLNVFEGVLSSVDPMGFAADLSDANGDTGILLTEIIGDGTADNPKDATIPNAADAQLWGSGNGPLNEIVRGFEVRSLPAPLAGSEPLTAQFAAVKTADVKPEADSPDPAVIISRFVKGSHGNPVNPSADREVSVEMVTQFIQFFATNGNISQSIVTDEALVEK